MKFRINYFIGFLIIFFVEVCIALYVHDAFIRPYVGDFLAVIAVYMLLMSFINVNRFVGLFVSLLFSYFIEWLQYIDFLSIVNWREIKLLRVVFGSSFSWGDMLAYTLGAVLVFIVDNKRRPL